MSPVFHFAARNRFASASAAAAACLRPDWRQRLPAAAAAAARHLIRSVALGLVVSLPIELYHSRTFSVPSAQLLVVVVVGCGDCGDVAGGGGAAADAGVVGVGCP